MPPSLFMYDTTVVLSVLTVLSCLSRGLGTFLRLERLFLQSEPDLMPPSLFMYDTTVVLSVLTVLSCLGTFLRLERLFLVAACFLEETRFHLQCACLSERHTLLLMRL